MAGKLELVHPSVGACNPREKGVKIYLDTLKLKGIRMRGKVVK
jgi:hypothetical protein